MNKDISKSLQLGYHPKYLPLGKTQKHVDHITEHTLGRHHIKLLTYNLYMRPPLVKTNESDHKDARLLEFAKQLSHYDIVCNQELFTEFNSRK